MSLNRLLNVDDLPSMCVHIAGWDEDDKRALLVVRALSNAEKRAVLAKSKADPNLEALWIARYAIKEPSGITDEHIKALDAKNPAVIEQIADISNFLGRYSVDTIRRYVRDYAGLEAQSDGPAEA